MDTRQRVNLIVIGLESVGLRFLAIISEKHDELQAGMGWTSVL